MPGSTKGHKRMVKERKPRPLDVAKPHRKKVNRRGKYTVTLLNKAYSRNRQYTLAEDMLATVG